MRSPVRIDAFGVYLFGLRFVRPPLVNDHIAKAIDTGWYAWRELPRGWAVFWARRKRRATPL